MKAYVIEVKTYKKWVPYSIFTDKFLVDATIAGYRQSHSSIGGVKWRIREYLRVESVNGNDRCAIEPEKARKK